jgi:hypothetical protein
MAALSPKGAAIGVAAFRVPYGVALTAAADLAATLAGRRGLPDGSPALAAAVIAGSIGLTGAALVAQDA